MVGDYGSPRDIECQRWVGSDGYMICDRCDSMWSPLLHNTGWLPQLCPDRTAPAPVAVGSRVTTRYFGGYEAVIIRQVHDDYLVVARMGGAAKNLDGGEATDILPKDQVEKWNADAPSAGEEK